MNITVSIIVPTYKRDELLVQCLDSLFFQDYPQENIELIVIDDSGDSRTDRVLKNLKNKHPNLKWLTQSHQGPAVARNFGVRSSQGRIIGFIDDDCVAARNWVGSMVAQHDLYPDIAAIGGLTVTATDRTAVVLGQFLANGSIETNINGRQETIFFPTCNVSFKRPVIEMFHFNEHFPLPGGEDLEIFWRLFKAGRRFLWNKDILVTHYRDDSLLSCVIQAYKYGRGNFLVQYLHKDQPLLKELQISGGGFWVATLINIFKIPRFSFILGSNLIKERQIAGVFKRTEVYVFFALHKIAYIIGNIVEFFRVRQDMRMTEILPADDLPRLVILDISHRCNLSCRICDIWQTGREEKDIDLDSVKRMLSQAKELGIKEIALSGGEVLLRSDIFEIIEYAREIKIKDLGILSNGLLINKYMERLKPYLLDNTISLVISLDSLEEKVHNFIRNSDTAWGETVSGLRKVSDLKKKFSHVNFNMITIILNDNLEELPRIADFALSLGVNSLQFQALLPNNLAMAERKASPFWIHEERLGLLDDALDLLVRIKEKSGFIRNSAKNLLLIKKYYRNELNPADVSCRSAEKTVLVSNQGTCVTCFSVYGDIRKQSLREILMGSPRVKAKETARKCHWPCLLPCFCD